MVTKTVMARGRSLLHGSRTSMLVVIDNSWLRNREMVGLMFLKLEFWSKLRVSLLW